MDVWIANMCDTATVESLNEDRNTYDLDTEASPQLVSISLELTPEWVEETKQALLTSVEELYEGDDLERDWYWKHQYAPFEIIEGGTRLEAHCYTLHDRAFGDDEDGTSETFGMVVFQRRPVRP